MVTDFIKVTVKCPAVINKDTEDYDVIITKDAVVGSLKKTIESVHPCRPSHEDQRLIFCGRVLTNDQSLVHVCSLANTEKCLTVHMVLRSGRYYGPRDERSPKVVKNDSIDNLLDSREDLENSNNPSLSNNLQDHRPNNSSEHDSNNSNVRLRASSSGEVVYKVGADGREVNMQKCVLFDGRRFYVPRGPNLFQVVRQNMDPFNLNNNRMAPMSTTPKQPSRIRSFLRRIDFYSVAAFLIRVGLLISILAKGGDPMKVALLCSFFIIILIFQSNLVDVTVFQRLWSLIMNARRQPTVPVRVEDEIEEGPAAPAPAANVDNIPPPPRNIFIKVIEVWTTFILSMFPGADPMPNQNPAAMN